MPRKAPARGSEDPGVVGLGGLGRGVACEDPKVEPRVGVMGLKGGQQEEGEEQGPELNCGVRREVIGDRPVGHGPRTGSEGATGAAARPIPVQASLIRQCLGSK